MATQQPLVEEQNVGLKTDLSNAPASNGPSDLNTDMARSITCVTPPEDFEKKEEEIRESERQAWFQNAVNEKLDNPTGYLQVAVLVVRWHQDLDKSWEGHDAEIEQLKHLFRDKFNYEYKEIVLGTEKKPELTLCLAIMAHVEEFDGPNNLLIVYYTGHGRLKNDAARGEERLELTPGPGTLGKTKSGHPATAIWTDAERPLLEVAEADVLAILDCCFASHAHKGHTEDRRVYELLAASAMNQTTRGPGPESFTTALISSLEGLLTKYEGKNFPTRKLMEKINMKRATPSVLWDRLHKCERHVQLAPLTKDKNSSMLRFSERPAEEAWVKLRFSLPQPLLEQSQIEALAHELPEAFERAKIMGLRRIDWLKMEIMGSLSLSAVAASVVMGVRWRSRSRSRTSLHSNSDQADQNSPTSKRPRLHIEAKSNPKRRAVNLSPEVYVNPRSSSETFASAPSDAQSLDFSD
ncbi:hypothetical protein IQ07DRAFT_646192 [Pyrenochaeta sp. DS3sAY3a]|nr:hypothetical protein IQ07DRAFT_646192 [Pyrenochaeta sp. DS3sAY3a]